MSKSRKPIITPPPSEPAADPHAFRPDPALYARMSKPRSREETESAFNAFDADVRAARERHGIANVLCIVSAFAHVVGNQGPAEQVVTVAACGDMANIAALGIAGFRWAREQHIEMFNRAAGVSGEEG